MNSTFLLACLTGFLVVELVFFFFAYRWLNQSKRQREKDFQLLDQERIELLKLQNGIMQDVQMVKKMSEDTLNQIATLGATTHAEWTEMIQKIEASKRLVEDEAKAVAEKYTDDLAHQSLILDKRSLEAKAKDNQLKERIQQAEKLLRFFDKNVPSEEILKDLQTERYEQARKMLEKGLEPSFISKKLGMSLSEVSLLSFIR